MGKADRISGSFWLIFSLFMSYHSYKLGLGTLHQPGPGFVFFWTGIVIALLSLTVVAGSFKRPSAGDAKESPSGEGKVTKVILVLASLFLYGMLLERLGFLIVTLLLLLFLLGIIEKKRWIFTIPMSLVITMIYYLVFEVGLQSQLPKGLLDFLRF
jgi:putative tricarboxylic transport membrane protein